MSGRLPRLTSRILAAPDRLCRALDELLLASPEHHALSRRIRRKQRQLRRLVEDDAWRTYLQMEEIVNERAAVEIELVVRWAFAAGARSRR
jgi:hypothetical protein